MRALLCRATGTRVAVTFTLSMDSDRDWANAVPTESRQMTPNRAIFFMAAQR